MDKSGKSKVPYSTFSTDYFRQQLQDSGIEIKNIEPENEKLENQNLLYNGNDYDEQEQYQDGYDDGYRDGYNDYNNDLSEQKKRDAIRQMRSDNRNEDVYQNNEYDTIQEIESLNKEGGWDYTTKRTTNFKQLEKDLIGADKELVRLQSHFREMEKENPRQNKTLEERIDRQKEYIESLETIIQTYKQEDYYNTQFQGLEERRAIARYDERLKIKQQKEEKSFVDNEKEQNKIIKKRTELENRLNTMRSKANDKSRSRVANEDDLNKINKGFNILYNKISSIGQSGELDINELMALDKAMVNMQNLITRMENANHIATQLRAKDFDTVKATEASGVDAVISKYKKDGYLTEETKTSLETIKKNISDATIAEDVIKQLNELDKVKAAHEAAKEEAKAIESSNLFSAKKDKAIGDVDRYIKRLQEVGKYEGDIKAKLDGIKNSINDAKTSKELEIARTNLSSIRQDVTDIVKEANKVPSKQSAKQSYSDKANELLENFKYRNQNSKGYSNITSEITELENRVKEVNSKNDFNKFNIDLQKLQKTLTSPVSGWHDTVFTSAQQALDSYKSLGADISNQVYNDGKLVSFNAKLKTQDGLIQRIKIDSKGAGGAIREMVSANPNVGLWEKFANQVKKSATYYKNYLSGYMSMQYIIGAVRSVTNEIVTLDDALIDINKTFQGSNKELQSMYSNSNAIAKQLGTTTQEVLQQEAAWSRAGYNTKATSEMMTRMSSMFASISPNMDVDTAQTGLISVMKAFSVQTDDVQRKILDNINSVGNAFATTNTEIIDGLQRSSSAMAAANNSLEETIALFTGGQEIVQNAETMGAALKTMSMRIRGFDEETEELSGTYENLSGEIANLTKTASTPGGISLFTDAEKTQFKSTYQILKEISLIWDDLTDKNRAELLEKLFAKTRAQAGAAILSNFDSVESALQTMMNAEGSADKEMENIQQSISYNLNELKQTWVGIWQELADRGDIVRILDMLTKLSEAIEFIIDKLGGLGTLGTILAPFLGANGLGLT